MEISIGSSRTARVALSIVAFTLAALGQATSARSQETASPPASEKLANLRLGQSCEIWLKTSQPGPRSKPDHSGTIKAITKDEIVVSYLSEGINEYRTPILGYLPYFGKFFTQVEIGRAEITSRVPIDAIANVKVVEETKTTGAR